MKNKNLHIRVTEEIKERVKAAAQDDGRTSSGFIINALQMVLKKRGLGHKKYIAENIIKGVVE